jgi:tetratricopeptide (TPR) repeat protein
MKCVSLIKTVFCSLFLISGSLLFAQNELFFEQGNALYNDGKYAEAIDKYQRILDSGQHSSELYYNMANAHYKLNNVAPSIFYYEKALQLKPEDEEILNNLSYAQKMTIDAIEAQPEVGFSKYLKLLINYFSYDTWAKLSLAFMFVFVFLFITYYFSNNTAKKRMAFIGFTSSLFIMSLTLLLAFQKHTLDKKNNPAIVFAQEASIKNGPNNESEELFQLHEGTKVQVIENFENWTKIKLPDGKIGWIYQEHIKLLNNI